MVLRRRLWLKSEYPRQRTDGKGSDYHTAPLVHVMFPPLSPCAGEQAVVNKLHYIEMLYSA
jgi:hypothetical protein